MSMDRDALVAALSNRRNNDVKVMVDGWACAVDEVSYQPNTDHIALSLNARDERDAVALAVAFDVRLRLQAGSKRLELERICYDEAADEVVYRIKP